MTSVPLIRTTMRSDAAWIVQTAPQDISQTRSVRHRAKHVLSGSSVSLGREKCSATSAHVGLCVQKFCLQTVCAKNVQRVGTWEASDSNIACLARREDSMIRLHENFAKTVPLVGAERMD